MWVRFPEWDQEAWSHGASEVTGVRAIRESGTGARAFQITAGSGALRVCAGGHFRGKMHVEL